MKADIVGSTVNLVAHFLIAMMEQIEQEANPDEVDFYDAISQVLGNMLEGEDLLQLEDRVINPAWVDTLVESRGK